MALSVGQSAPNFTLKGMTPEGLAAFTLQDYHGKQNVVLLFFPAAFTGVCTQEMCDLSNGLNVKASDSTAVFGISCDTPFAQGAWAKAEKITATLLSDYAHTVTQAFDVVLSDLAGLGPACQRAAFVIDRGGFIRYSEVTANPGELPNFEALNTVLAELS